MAGKYYLTYMLICTLCILHSICTETLDYAAKIFPNCQCSTCYALCQIRKSRGITTFGAAFSKPVAEHSHADLSHAHCARGGIMGGTMLV
jgi:hypothetical protein